MKLSIIGLILLFGSNVYAGSANCTGGTPVTAFGDYWASTSDCNIFIDKDFFEYTTVYLPASASVGDEFTIFDNTPYEYDVCDHYYDEYEQQEVYYCQPAGIGITSLDAPTVYVGSGITYVQAGLYPQASPHRTSVKFVYDGSNWIETEI